MRHVHGRDLVEEARIRDRRTCFDGDLVLRYRRYLRFPEVLRVASIRRPVAFVPSIPVPAASCVALFDRRMGSTCSALGLRLWSTPQKASAGHPVGDVSDELVAPGTHVLEVDVADTSEETFARAENDGSNVESQFIDESRGEVLIDGCRATGD